MSQKFIPANYTSKLNEVSANIDALESAEKSDKIIRINHASNLDISRADAAAIYAKLREQGILNSEDTLEQWLSSVTSKITDGGSLTINELLTGLKQFSQL